MRDGVLWLSNGERRQIYSLENGEAVFQELQLLIEKWAPLYPLIASEG